MIKFRENKIELQQFAIIKFYLFINKYKTKTFRHKNNIWTVMVVVEPFRSFTKKKKERKKGRLRLRSVMS